MVEIDKSAAEMVQVAASLAPALMTAAAVNDVDGRFPRESLTVLKRAGLCVAPLPVAFGGQDLNDPRLRLELLLVLKHIGRGDLVAGRIYEGHVNALQLIFDFGNPQQGQTAAEAAQEGLWFGVWNSEMADGVRLLADSTSPGHGWHLEGSKAYATGAGQIDRPLLTARRADGGWIMVLADGHDPALVVDTSFWQPLGMRASGSHRVALHGVKLRPQDLIGAPGDYYREPQFNAGAARFAAVQLGGAEAILDETRRFLRSVGRTDDPYQRARLGEMAGAVLGGNLWFDSAQRHPDNVAHSQLMRCAVEQIGLRVMQLAERCVGARGLLRPWHIERLHRDLTHYLRQPGPDAAQAAAGAHVLASDKDSWLLWGR